MNATAAAVSTRTSAVLHNARLFLVFIQHSRLNIHVVTGTGRGPTWTNTYRRVVKPSLLGMGASMIRSSAVIFKGRDALFEEACTRGYNHCAVLHDLLSRDLASLIHPQHDPAVQRAGRVWVRGDGAMLTDADGKEYIDGLAGLWNVVLGHGRRELADAAREQMETLALRVRLRRQLEPASDRAGRAAWAADVSEHQSLLLHLRRCRGERDGDQGRALVLEAARPACQDEGHLTRARLPRHDAGGDERDGDCRILAAVRAARAGVHSRRSAIR